MNELFAGVIPTTGIEFAFFVLIAMVAGTVNLLISTMVLWALEKEFGRRISWFVTLLVMLVPAFTLAVLAGDPRDRFVGAATFLGSAAWLLITAYLAHKQSLRRSAKGLVAGNA